MKKKIEEITGISTEKIDNPYLNKRKKFEYISKDFTSFTPTLLNELGEEGWQVVDFQSYGSGVVSVLLMREI